MDGRETVSAVIPKMAREVMDVFIEPILKRREAAEKSGTDDVPGILRQDNTEENSR
jgi:hypothetical protein